MKPALLIIDMQEVYYKINPQMQQEMMSAIYEINALADSFRTKNLPVYVIYHREDSMNITPGEEGFEMHPFLNIKETDMKIIKTHSSAFIDTTLDSKLKEKGVDTIIMTGLSTEYCVLATYHGAAHYHFQPILYAPGLASVGGISSTILSFTEHLTYAPMMKIVEKM